MSLQCVSWIRDHNIWARLRNFLRYHYITSMKLSRYPITYEDISTSSSYLITSYQTDALYFTPRRQDDKPPATARPAAPSLPLQPPPRCAWCGQRAHRVNERCIWQCRHCGCLHANNKLHCTDICRVSRLIVAHAIF